MDNTSISINRGERLERYGDVLCFGGKRVCIYRSLVGKKHFAKDDDGKGLERGALTYALAYAPRLCFGGNDPENPGPQQRFTDEELDIILSQWSDYIKPDIDMVLFNDKFFDESPQILRKIAKSVHIEVAEGGANYV